MSVFSVRCPVPFGLLGCLAAAWGTLAATAAYADDPDVQALARSIIGADQGVLVRGENGATLASLHADRAVHPASVTKVATSLALLRRLGPDHRFDTTLSAGGVVADGAVAGGLVIQADGDPFFVYENAFLVLMALRDLGIRRVDDGLVVRGPLVFNWTPDPHGAHLRRTFEGRDGGAAWAVVRAASNGAAPADIAAVALRFGASSSAGRAGPARTSGGGGIDPGAPLLVHRSPPLRRIVKEMNGYSNNVFHGLSERVGGPRVVEEVARAAVPAEMRAEVVIDNAAGAGTRNRMSPRAAAALVSALRDELAARGLRLVDVLPVAGIDRGTLADRLREAPFRGVVVGKTGTYGSLGACAIAGALRTRQYGEITFAILNRGLPVPEARRRQDAFLRALMRESGPIPWTYEVPRGPAFAEARVDVLARPSE